VARLIYKGATVDVPKEKVDRLLRSGFTEAEKPAPKKTTSKRSTAKSADK
jgi:hypothetical protein